MQTPNYRRLFANAGSNATAHVAYVIVSFFMAPIVLHGLGDSRYGAWSFVESFVAYLTLFDLGVAAALVRYVPRFVVQGNDRDLSRTYSAALSFFAAGGLLAIVLGGLFETTMLNRFLADMQFQYEIRWLFRLLVLNFSLTLPLSVFPAVLDGLGRFGVKASVRTAMLLARIPLTLFALSYERKLIALGCVITACNLVEHLVLALAVRRFLPQMHFVPREIDRATIGRIAGYSRDAFVAMMAGRLSFQTDAFVIAPILGAASVTVFSLPSRLVDMARSLLRSATTTLTTAFSTLEAQGDSKGLRATFLSASRAAWYVALPIQMGLLTLGRPFLTLWLGERYSSLCTPILWLLAPMLGLTIAQSVASRVLYATGKLRWFARATILEGVANLGFSLLLIFPFGVAGVAGGTLIPHVAFCFFVIAYVCKGQSVGWIEYVRQLALPHLAVIAPSMIWWQLSTQAQKSWLTFLGVGMAGFAIYLLTMLVIRLRAALFTRRLGRSTANPLPLRAAG